MILNKPQASQIRVNSSIVLAADKVIYSTAGIKLTLKQGSVIKIIAVDDNEDQFEFIGKSNDVIDENNNHYASNYITGAIELVQGDFDFAEPGNSSDMRDGVAGMEEMLGSVVEAGDELTVLKYKDSDDYSDLDQAADNTIVEAPLDESNMFGDPVEGDEFYEEAAKKTANELNDKPEPPKMGKIPDRIHNPKEDIARKKTANVPDDSEIVGEYGDVYGTLTLKDGSTITFNGEQGSYKNFLSVNPTAIASHGEDVYVEKKDGTKILLDSVGAVEDFIENNRTGSKKVQAYFQVGDMIKKIQDVDDKPKEVKKVYFDHASNTHMYDVATLGKITDAEIEQYTKVGKDETVNIWKPGKNKYDDPSKHGYEGEAQPKDLKKLPRKGSKRLSRKK